ncbi:MAG TPA: YdgA family protein [Steroidobacteraceae bacterium]|nr:YdgA family protein [Steroidobacteraceae bacterium]
MNNRAIIGVSAAAILVIGYVAASWGLGRAVHSGFDAWEQQTATQPLPMLKIVERRHTPGVFSSVEDVTFEFNSAIFDQFEQKRRQEQQRAGGDDEDAAEEPTNKPPVRFTVRNDIKHGPLPGFTGIGMGRIDSKLLWTEDARKELDQFLPGREPVEISTLLGLLGGSSSHVTSPAFDFKDEKSTVAWKGFEGDFSVGRNLGSIGCNATAPGLSLYDADGTGAKFEALKLTCDGDRVFDEFYNGTVNLEIANVEGRTRDGTPMRMQKFSYASDVRAEGEYLNMAAKVGVGALDFLQYDLSEIKYHLSLRHLHGPTYAALMRKMQSSAMSSTAGDPAASLALAGAFGEFGPQLLEHSPQIVIDHIGFKAPEGEFGINGTVELADFKKDDLATPQGRTALMTKVVANADVWISEGLLNKDWSGTTAAEPTDVRAQETPGPSKVEALRQQVAAFEQQGFVTRKDGQIRSHIQFKGGALTANGKPLQ